MSTSVLTGEVAKMLDPLTLACVLAGLAGIIAVVSDVECDVEEGTLRRDLFLEDEVALHTEHPDENKENQSEHSYCEVTVVNINDLDSNKVLTRVASLEEIEPEYISYLATYFHDTNAKDFKFDLGFSAHSSFNRCIALRKHRVISELTSKLQSLSVAEAASKQQIVHLNNIRIENDSLKSALSKSTVEAAAAAKALANFEAVKASNAELSGRLAKVTRSLNESVEQNAALKRDISEYSKQTAALESLKLEFATLDSLTRKLKAELEEKTRAVEEAPTIESDPDSWKRVESERDEIAHQFAQARIEWEKKEAALMNEYTSLKNLVDELNREVAKFEQFKKEQDELEQKLHAREAELAEKSARLVAAETEKQVLVVKGNDRSAELETENIGLRKKLSELENKLSEVKSSFKLKSTDAGSEKSPESHERIQDVNVCKSNNTLESEDDVASLRAENSRLQQKNEELRHRNFKILDHVAGLEKQLAEKLSTELPRSKSREAKCNSIEAQLLDERKLVASTIGSIVDAPMGNSNYNDYINDLANSLKAALRCSRKYDNDKDKTTLAKLQAEIERYKGAFNTLSALLTQIELGVQEQESFYKDRVAELQSELNKAQIQILRAYLGQNHEEKGKTFMRNCIARSDDSDLEIVSR
ncbi:unnamed protein product [Angiostrongylus costaricensis]|uniref:Nucleoprotein TPR n=1 Tax=Angiostrongylus costaricensis TaxID=334426 RepID=A0A0R3PMH7_ANGCS|nr:unnamed protein product [Angiostrongylus costaricensis]